MATAVIYNRISLEVVETREFSKNPVYDARGNYMYTKCRLVVEAVYNPEATAYRLDAEAVG